MDGLQIIANAIKKALVAPLAQIADLENRVSHLEKGVPAAGAGMATSDPVKVLQQQGKAIIPGAPVVVIPIPAQGAK